MTSQLKLNHNFTENYHLAWPVTTEYTHVSAASVCFAFDCACMHMRESRDMEWKIKQWLPNIGNTISKQIPLCSQVASI